MKNPRGALLIFTLLAAFSSEGAVAANLSSSDTIEIKVDQKDVDQQSRNVWQRFGPFCEIAEWHPVVLSCSEGKEDGVIYRTLSLKDGSKIKEKLLRSSSLGYEYAIVESPLPVKNYQASFSVTPKGDELDLVWSASYDAADGKSDTEARAAIDGVLRDGIASIKSKLDDFLPQKTQSSAGPRKN